MQRGAATGDANMGTNEAIRTIKAAAKLLGYQVTSERLGDNGCGYRFTLVCLNGKHFFEVRDDRDVKTALPNYTKEALATFGIFVG